MEDGSQGHSENGCVIPQHFFAEKKVKVGTNYLNSHGLNGIRVNQ